MNITCPHCETQLKFSDKFRESLSSLKPGQKAKVRCAQCEKPFAVDSSMAGGMSSADPAAGKAQTTGVIVKPPGPPDVAWLEEGVYEDQEVVEEIPLALVLVPENCGRGEVIKAVEGLGYRAEVMKSGRNAMEKMEFVNYASVVLHAEFEPEGLDKGVFYNYMRTMSMTKRRYIFFVLLGKKLHTLYDLQALAYSANIVVNDKDVKYFGTILRKAIPDYESLFGPLMEEMRIVGK